MFEAKLYLFFSFFFYTECLELLGEHQKLSFLFSFILLNPKVHLFKVKSWFIFIQLIVFKSNKVLINYKFKPYEMDTLEEKNFQMVGVTV